MMNEIDPLIADVYRFFIHGYDKDFRKHINYLRLSGDRSYFNILVSISVSSHVIENEEDLGYFLERYWI